MTSTTDLIAATLDRNTFRSWRFPARVPVGSAGPAAPLPRYRRRLEREAAATGLDSSVTCGEGSLAGHPVAVIASEFAFLGGSVGAVEAEVVTGAVQRATEAGLPLLVSPASGGTRLQEGAAGLVGMVKIAQAVAAHRAAGLLYLVYLRGPSTGGVLASWGGLGQLTAAEPGALVGFLGPRAVEAVTGAPLPEQVQRAETLAARGVIDAVLDPARLRPALRRVLDVALSPPGGTAQPPAPEAEAEPTGADPTSAEPTGAEPSGAEPNCAEPSGADPTGAEPNSAWAAVQATRRPDRPGVRELVRAGEIADTGTPGTVIRIGGTGAGERSDGLLTGLTRFGSSSCVLIGQDRRGQTREPLGPGSLRKARRAIALAAELNLPIVTVIDTGGAELSAAAEHGGLTFEIAGCLSDLATCPQPVVSVLLGAGTGGAAVALAAADRVLCAEHGWLAPMPLEGAAAVLLRDPSRAPQVAADQRITAADLLAAGVVDQVVPERPDAADEPVAFSRRVAATVEETLLDLLGQDRDTRVAARRERYRRI